MKKVVLGVLGVLTSAGVLAAVPVSNAATVLTLEGGFVGLQHIFHFTPLQLQGGLCDAPNQCRPVDYFAFPGDTYNDQGAEKVVQAISDLPGAEPIVLFGHSQGGQVIYTDLRKFAADPANAPDPARLSWVSIGNPENRYGGRRAQPDDGAGPWLPDDTAYQGTEVIRQYDGWADWPDDTSNFLAVANAVVGMFTTHTDYWNVDLNAPSNVRLTPDLPGGAPGNVTYVWVPTDVLPLVAWAGPLAPMLDNLLRPTVESAYHRPVDIPDPTPPAAPAAPTAVAASVMAAPDRPARRTGAAKRSAPRASTPQQHRRAIIASRHSRP